MKKQTNQKSFQVPLDGSFKFSPKAKSVPSINSNEGIEVTIRVRRKKSVEDALKKAVRISHEDYEKNYGATNEDIKLVEEFAHEHHLSISEIHVARRTIKLFGRIRDFENAFNVHLHNYEDSDGNQFRGRTGEIFIPGHLGDIIEGVFGLDNRPAARTHHRLLSTSIGKFSSKTVAFNGYDPRDVATAYGFPMNMNGKGQCIGIIELGGGFKNTDLKNYFNMIGIQAPAIKSVSVDGGFNHPTGSPDGPDGEVALDIEVAGAIANGASIVVYFTKNTDQGFLDAITTAIHDNVNKPSIISISWGSAEIDWTEQAMKNFNQAFQSASLLGITICASSGDDGSGDGVGDKNVHVDFPAASPFILACGGTKLKIKNNKVASEVVWNESSKEEGAGGGGVSEYFALPDYQKKVNVPVSLNSGFKGRGVPDIAGNADPETGFIVTVDGQTSPIGGTSAVAPLMAAFIALINQKKKTNAGFIHPVLYAKPAGKTRDINTGNNISNPPGKGYKAGKGWDACTGWGVLFNF